MSAFYLANPQNKDPERALSLQRYLILHSQQQVLRRRLSPVPFEQPLPTAGFLTRHSRSPSTHSVASLPSSRASSRSSSVSISAPTSPSRHETAPPTDPLPPTNLRTEDDLYIVNHEIKTTLTAMLNCASVKHSAHLRMWVQTRLMAAEMELRQHRKRRSSASESDFAPFDADESITSHDAHLYHPITL